MVERERYPSEAADRFQIRLPPGLRDRIKAYAEAHGRSMNTEIVRVLEREFPEPWTLDGRVTQLLGALEILKSAGDATELVDALVADVHETLEGIVSGLVTDADDEARMKVQRALARWNEEETEANRYRFEMTLDDEEIEALNRTGRTEKF